MTDRQDQALIRATPRRPPVPRLPGSAVTIPARGQVMTPPVPLVGDGIPVACADGTERPYLYLDAAASTAALGPVLARVEEFIPLYAIVHRGVDHKSRTAAGAHEDARAAALAFAGRIARPADVAIICRSTTEALSNLACRLRLTRADTVVTTVAEHHAIHRRSRTVRTAARATSIRPATSLA